MKKYSYHDKHYKVILFQAAVVTLLFHMAMLYSFVYEAPIKKAGQTTGRKIIIFNPIGNDNEQGQEMARWLEYHDPSLIAHPNYLNGYGVVSRRQKIRTAIDDLKPIAIPHSLINPPQKFQSLTSGNEMKFDSNARFVGYQTVAVRPRAASNSISAPQNYPLFKLPNGQYVDGILTTEELNYHHLSTAKTTNNTILQAVITSADMMPRITIKQSCGVAKLDRLAIRKLLLNRQLLFKTAKPTAKRLFISVIWRGVKQ
jgi:hypothetical protein